MYSHFCAPWDFHYKGDSFYHKRSDFLLSGIYGYLTCLLFYLFFSLCLCTWTQDEGLTFLPWLAEGQYYRKRWQSCPILKLWGLIFLKSLVIVFDKSIWEAFRERIRDAPWPTFLSPPTLSPTPPPQVLDQTFNQACLKDGHSNLQPPPSCNYHDQPCDRHYPRLSLCIPNTVDVQR